MADRIPDYDDPGPSEVLIPTLTEDGVRQVYASDLENWLAKNQNERPPGSGPGGQWTVKDEAAAMENYRDGMEFDGRPPYDVLADRLLDQGYDLATERQSDAPQTVQQQLRNLRTSAARTAMESSRPQPEAETASSDSPPQGYIVHPDGFTEYFEDPAVTAQAERDTAESMRQYKMEQEKKQRDSQVAKDFADATVEADQKQADLNRRTQTMNATINSILNADQIEADQTERRREANLRQLQQEGPSPISPFGPLPRLMYKAYAKPSEAAKDVAGIGKNVVGNFSPLDPVDDAAGMADALYRQDPLDVAAAGVDYIPAAGKVGGPVAQYYADEIKDYYGNKPGVVADYYKEDKDEEGTRLASMGGQGVSPTAG